MTTLKDPERAPGNAFMQPGLGHEARRSSSGGDERAEICLSWYQSRPVAAQECDETTAAADRNETATEAAAIVVKRMWEVGPLRQWSEKRETSRWIRHGEGWAGMYVCEACREPAPMGVHSLRLGHDSVKAKTVLWLCGTCREARRKRGEQPTGLRAYRARKREEALMGIGLDDPSSSDLAMRRAKHSIPLPSSASSPPEHRKPIHVAGPGRQSFESGANQGSAQVNKITPMQPVAGPCT